MNDGEYIAYGLPKVFKANIVCYSFTVGGHFSTPLKDIQQIKNYLKDKFKDNYMLISEDGTLAVNFYMFSNIDASPMFNVIRGNKPLSDYVKDNVLTLLSEDNEEYFTFRSPTIVSLLGDQYKAILKNNKFNLYKKFEL